VDGVASKTKAGTRTLYLIDGHAQFFRAYHAIGTRMTSPVTKEPTNMTFGFVGMLLKVLRDYRPDYLAVVIDVSGDRESFRSELYPEYKANRDEAPEDLGPQIDRCLEILGTMDVPVLGVAGVEADDVIATIVKQLRAEAPDVNIRIVSRDKDLTQLLDEAVELFDVHRDESVSPEQVFKTEGVEPKHVVDILALMGDTIDNVPGVPGIGPKTAAKLVLEYGSMDALLERLDEIKGKRRENLEASRDQLPLSRRLVELKDDVDVDFALDRAECDPATMPIGRLQATFRELGFNLHINTLHALAASAGAAEGGAGGGEDAEATPDDPGADAFAGGLFDGAAAETTTATPRATYECVTTAEGLKAVVERIRAAGTIGIATVTDPGSPMRAPLAGIGIAVTPGEAVYVPVRSPTPSSHLDAAAVVEGLRPVLQDEGLRLVGHDVKRDLVVLRRHGVRPCEKVTGGFRSGALFDTMVASYVIDATRSSHRLDTLALAVLGHTCVPRDEVLGRGRTQVGFDHVALETATAYAAEMADVTLRLRDAFVPELDATGLAALFHDLEMRVVPVLAELEYNGIHVDPDELARQRERVTERADDLRRRIGEAAPHEFSPDSPKQLAVALFNAPDDDPPGLGIRVVKRGKTGPSTDQEVLERLAADPDVDSPVPELLIEYRQLTKLVNTYLVALAEAIDPSTRRVHASFHQTVAATGRLSSSDPNLQNIPIRTEVGREIRRAFVAEPGNVLITADYSQIELRLLAHLSGDAGLAAAFRDGHDIHAAVAAEVFGVAPEDVTIRQRSAAKMVNFGIVYGITPFGLARRLGPTHTIEEARGIIEDYKLRFSGIDAFLADCVAQAHVNGYVETIMKRRRKIPQIAMRNPNQRALGERMAINTVVQGSAADLIKLAMVELYRALPERFPDARMLLQIHDELVFEAPEDQAEAIETFVVERMEGAMELDVPLVADAAHSTSWIDAK
jgi:DNA polymerase-1